MNPVIPLRNLVPAAVRTLVPFLYPLLAPFVINFLGGDAEQLNAVLTIVVGWAAYVVLAYAEKFVPWVGVLLGWKAQPVYATPVKSNTSDATPPPPPVVGSGDEPTVVQAVISGVPVTGVVYPADAPGVETEVVNE